MIYDPAKQGYRVMYRPGRVNHCPGCGRSHWHVGRSTAECAWCHAALPIAEREPQLQGVG